ncbi:MAG: GGDEF domain-containing protein [Methylomonas sp.]|nr:GGDEF domain-containing protein [Methylomonas sp.]
MTSSNSDTSLAPSPTLVTETIEGSTSPRIAEPYLVILSGHERGKHFKLKKQQNIFGRSEEVDIVISDPKISRTHGVFTVYQGHILFEDLQSTNGTFLGGERIVKRWLGSLDRLSAGDTTMRIDYKCPTEAQSEQALYQAAYTDALTGILNRGAFMQRAFEEFSLCLRNSHNLTIVMCDVDFFKNINDNHGHLAGDAILKELANILNREMRCTDLLARYGGEEFIMLLRETTETDAVAWAERIRQTVMQHQFTYQGQSIPTTISMGVCTRRVTSSDSLPIVIKLADDALYAAKQNGRNRLEVSCFGMS